MVWLRINSLSSEYFYFEGDTDFSGLTSVVQTLASCSAFS